MKEAKKRSQVVEELGAARVVLRDAKDALDRAEREAERKGMEREKRVWEEWIEQEIGAFVDLYFRRGGGFR